MALHVEYVERRDASVQLAALEEPTRQVGCATRSELRDSLDRLLLTCATGGDAFSLLGWDRVGYVGLGRDGYLQLPWS